MKMEINNLKYITKEEFDSNNETKNILLDKWKEFLVDVDEEKRKTLFVL